MHRNAIAALIAVIVTAAFYSANAALLPPAFLDSVVALGAMVNTAPPGQPPKVEWATVGTGFFYGHKVKDDPDGTKRLYEIDLVTAGHVVSEFKESKQGDLSVRINSKDSTKSSQTFNIPFNPAPQEHSWFFHPKFDPKTVALVPDYDVAIFRVNGQVIKELGAAFIEDDKNAADVKKLKQIGTSAGDGAFVLGFPMNLAGVQRNYVIVRKGIVARISEMLDRRSMTFLLDLFVFPGNSGSPVVLKPEITAISDTSPNNVAYVIGIVNSYRPYTDVAVSQQTHRARIIFEENSGLAEVIPLDRVDETIQAYRTTFP